VIESGPTTGRAVAHIAMLAVVGVVHLVVRHFVRATGPMYGLPTFDWPLGSVDGASR